jgi:hypothetical protein
MNTTHVARDLLAEHFELVPCDQLMDHLTAWAAVLGAMHVKSNGESVFGIYEGTSIFWHWLISQRVPPVHYSKGRWAEFGTWRCWWQAQSPVSLVVATCYGFSFKIMSTSKLKHVMEAKRRGSF